MNYELLHALADNQLDAETADRVRNEMRQDSDMASEFQAILDLKKFVQTHAVPVANDALWVSCQGRFREQARAKRVDSFVGRYAWAMSATVLGFIVVGGLMQRNSPAGNVESADIARIMMTMEPSVKAEAPSPVLKRWVQGAFALAQESAASNKLVVRYAEAFTVEGRPIERYFLRDGAGKLVLVVLPGVKSFNGLETVPGNSSVATGQMGKSNFVAWNNHGAGFVLIGDRKTADLAVLAERLDSTN